MTVYEITNGIIEALKNNNEEQLDNLLIESGFEDPEYAKDFYIRQEGYDEDYTYTKLRIEHVIRRKMCCYK